MSGRFKLPSIEEITAKRRGKKSKGKAVEPEPLRVEEAAQPKPVESARNSIESSEKKRKLPIEWDEDAENVIVKIPRGATVMSDPSSLSGFVGRLLLEEDEMRLNDLGPVEAARRAIALNYETLECSLFQQKCAEAAQRRVRDLEKSNTCLRKELAEAKASIETAERRAREMEGEVKAVQATLDLERETARVEVEAYKESIESFKKEKEELMERLEGVAYEAMLAERSNLMKQYLAGEHDSWSPQRWIRKYARVEAGLSSSSDEGDEGEGGERRAAEEENFEAVESSGRVEEETPAQVVEDVVGAGSQDAPTAD